MTAPTVDATDGAGPVPSEPDQNPLAFPDGVVTRNVGLGYTGGMLALVPADGDQSNLAIDGGEDPAELHMTLAYLGDDMSQLSPEQMADLHQQTANLAEAVRNGDAPSPGGQVFGHAHFNPGGGPDGDKDPVAVYLAEGAGYPELHDAATRIGSSALGDLFPAQHANFQPHISASYNHTPAALHYTGPVNFDRLRLALGDNQTDYPLTEADIMPDAQTAAAVAADPNPAPIDPASLADVGGTPVTFPVVIVEGMETSDHRYIEPGSLSHRALPLPILAQTVNSGDGHKGAEVVGKLTSLTRVPGPQVTNKETGEPFPEGTFVWQGAGEIDPNTDGGRSASKGYLTGNSADLSDMTAEYELLDGDGNELAAGQERLVVSGGKIAATTLVPIPAFAEAYITIDGQEMTPADDADTTMVASAWRSGEVGDDCLLCEILASAEFDEEGYELASAPNAATRKRAAAKGDAIKNPDGSISYPMDTKDLWDKAVKAVGRGNADHDAIRRKIISVGKKHGWKAPDNWNPDGSLKNVTASGFTEAVQPAYYFANPQLTAPTALTVDDDGHVFGHLATWGTCHIGFAGQCVTPPRSGSDYGYFATGAIRVRDSADSEIRTQAVGHITLGTGHASTSLAAKPAAEHYDNTGSVVADVAAGEDVHGIWVSGRVRPDADVNALRAAALSGDWRKINGHLELVAALGVNVPGFPIPRARVASGEQVALVAAGAVKRTFDTEAAPTVAAQLDHEQLADAIMARLQERGVLPQQGLDVGGDETGSSDLAARTEALRALGLDARDRALRDLSLGEFVGPKGYKHGWIKVGGGEGAPNVEAAANSLAMKGTTKAARSAVKDTETEHLHALDKEMARRATMLGKSGQVSKVHKAVKDELAARGAKSRV